MGFDFRELLRIGILVDKQSPDIALGVDKGGAGDQGIMYGYATNETAEQMPIPYMVATKFLQLLKNHPSKMFRADAKRKSATTTTPAESLRSSAPCSTARTWRSATSATLSNP